MPTPTFPDHLLTVQQWDALPEQTYRWAELAEGVLEVVPGPTLAHQFALSRVMTQIATAAADAGYALLPSVAAVIDAAFPATIRQPDISIVGSSVAASTLRMLTASDVAVVVEITAVGTRRRDRVTKRSEYETAQIPHYWIIDPTGPAVTLEALDLTGGHYQLSQQVQGGLFTFTDPFPGGIDLDALHPQGTAASSADE